MLRREAFEGLRVEQLLDARHRRVRAAGAAQLGEVVAQDATELVLAAQREVGGIDLARVADLAIQQQRVCAVDLRRLVLRRFLRHLIDGTQDDVVAAYDTVRAELEAYDEAAKQYSFLKYHPKSIKPSLFSYLGNYLGFQGYYNPFSGEGQVNTTVPRFLEPFVTTHEIAHQLGYGKENEANFVGYLASKSYNSAIFRYSVYYDMYNYAVGEVYRRDTTLAKSFQVTVHPQVKKDQQEFRDFYRRYRNPVEPVVMWGYGHFLKANNQPAGKRSYNEVVAWLIAYYKKFGIGAL